jgi:hypothetical protein
MAEEAERAGCKSVRAGLEYGYQVTDLRFGEIHSVGE